MNSNRSNNTSATAQTEGYFATPRTSRSDYSEIAPRASQAGNIDANGLIARRESLNMRSPAHMASTSNNSLAKSQGSRNNSQPHQSAGSSRATHPQSGGSVSSLPPPSHFAVHRVDATHVKLSWDPMDNATHYVVHNLTTGGSTGQICAVQPRHRRLWQMHQAPVCHTGQILQLLSVNC